MARGLTIKKTKAEQAIMEVYLANPRRGATKIRERVIARLHDEKDSLYEPYLDDPNWPRVSAVQKHLKKIRKNDEARSPESKGLDTPWSIGTLAQYPIPPEALLAVLRAFYAERRTDVATDEYFRTGYEFGYKTYLTIREALWIARLSVLFKYPTLAVSASPEEDIAQYARFNLVTAKLVKWAHMYALEEQTAEILEKPLDTSHLDIGFYIHARDEIFRSLVSCPRLIRYSWQDTLNHLEKEAQNERTHTSKE